ncbi:MAG TPA: head GIN domain-containing protein [Pyrinomonadaceae bacterium]|jgi:hypothetical protein|nr:head GIN domain-containing protein [Pyrinomonadaceae bacterium]
MKKLLLTLIIFGALSTGFACRFIGRGIQGSGVLKSERRDLREFKSIESSGAYQMSITCRQTQSFEIEGDDNILPIIKTEVRDGVLHINNENGYNPTKPLVIRIAVSDLEQISSTGAGDIHIANVKNDKLALNSNGAANVEASGQTKFVDISSNGAGNIETSKLIADRAKVTVSGAANVDVYASQQLDVNVSGIGSVTYSGNPPVVNKSVSGIGSISKKD